MAFASGLLGLAMTAVYSSFWAKFPMGFGYELLAENERFGFHHWLSILTPPALWLVGLGIGILILKTRDYTQTNKWLKYVLLALPFVLAGLYVFFTKRFDAKALMLGILPCLPFLIYHHRKSTNVEAS